MRSRGGIRVKWGIPAFVVTLAMMLAYKGLAKVITSAYPVTPFPESFSFWGQGYVLNVIPVPAVLMIVTVGIFYFLSTRTVFGRSVYSVGGNEEASRLSGIPVGRTRILVFITAGLMAALGGIITSSRIMAGSHSVGEGLEFDVIAAVVIGGTSLAGGAGVDDRDAARCTLHWPAEQRHGADGRRPILAGSRAWLDRAGGGVDQRDPETDPEVVPFLPPGTQRPQGDCSAAAVFPVANLFTGAR
jgi:hypothetical protein